MSVFNPIIAENSNMDNNQSNKDESEVEIISKKRKIDVISPTESNTYTQNFFSENPYYAICNIKVFEKIHTRKCVTLFIAQYSNPKLSIKFIKTLDLITKCNIYNLLVLANPKVEYILLKNSDIYLKVMELIPNGVITEYSSSNFELFNDYLKLSLKLPESEFIGYKGKILSKYYKKLLNRNFLYLVQSRLIIDAQE